MFERPRDRSLVGLRFRHFHHSYCSRQPPCRMPHQQASNWSANSRSRPFNLLYALRTRAKTAMCGRCQIRNAHQLGRTCRPPHGSNRLARHKSNRHQPNAKASVCIIATCIITISIIVTIQSYGGIKIRRCLMPHIAHIRLPKHELRQAGHALASWVWIPSHRSRIVCRTPPRSPRRSARGC